MPVEWAIIFLGVIVACGYFSYNAGLKEGVEVATVLTLQNLESNGLIHFDNNGTIKSGTKHDNGVMNNERDGSEGL